MRRDEGRGKVRIVAVSNTSNQQLSTDIFTSNLETLSKKANHLYTIQYRTHETVNKTNTLTLFHVH